MTRTGFLPILPSGRRRAPIFLPGRAESSVSGEDHWRAVPTLLRDYYLQNGRAPLHRELKKGVGMSLMEIEDRFPGGIKQGARRLAGLPNPKTCGM